MPAREDVDAVLARFGIEGSRCAIEALGNAGGFSGARLWKVQDRDRTYCLRRWPAELDETRLRFIHAVLEFAGMQIEFVPRLRRTADGETAIRHVDHFWELTNWLPGVADFRTDPAPSRLEAALAALAHVHLALEHFPTRMTGVGRSLGLQQRRERVEAFAAMLSELHGRLPQGSPELQVRGRAVLTHFETNVSILRTQLPAASEVLVPLQPCLRDIWHDHVLFTGDEVAGMVDWDAVRIDTVAGDIARLLGSLVGDDAALRDTGLAAYESIRPLADTERELIDVFDFSSLVMSGMQWLEWLLIDKRRFDDLETIFARLDQNLTRLAFRTRRIWTP